MRDLKADLELCNKATPGPWLETDKSNLEVFVENTWGEPVLYELQYDGPHTAIKQEDMEFMIAAREGWPYAIERATKAEALARELVEAAGALVDDLEWSDKVYASWPPYVQRVEVLLAKAKEVLGDGSGGD